MASNTTPTKVVTYQALNGALTRLKTKLATKNDISGLEDNIITLAQYVQPLRETDYISIAFNRESCELEVVNIPNTFYQYRELHNTIVVELWDASTNKVLNASATGIVIGFDPGNSLTFVFGINGFDAGIDGIGLVHLALASGTASCIFLNDSKFSSIFSNLDVLKADVATLKSSAGSGQKTWNGGILNYVENSEEYTPVSSNFNWSNLDDVKVGDAVEFEIRQDVWTTGKLVGMVYSIEYNISNQASGRTRAGFTVLLDPFYGTGWKYRQLKIRFTDSKMTVYDI